MCCCMELSVTSAVFSAIEYLTVLMEQRCCVSINLTTTTNNQSHCAVATPERFHGAGVGSYSRKRRYGGNAAALPVHYRCSWYQPPRPGACCVSWCVVLLTWIFNCSAILIASDSNGSIYYTCVNHKQPPSPLPLSFSSQLTPIERQHGVVVGVFCEQHENN